MSIKIKLDDPKPCATPRCAKLRVEGKPYCEKCMQDLSYFAQSIKIFRQGQEK